MITDLRQFLSECKFLESYSRYRDDLGRYETWDEAVDRVMDMHRGKYAKEIAANPRLGETIDDAALAYKDKLIIGSQRALQYGGEQILKHQARLYNCTASYTDRPAFFGEAFYLLLCGCGVGFSVQKHHIAKLPEIANRTKQPKIHTIDDSIEGWATALDVLLSSFFEDGGKHPEYRGHRVYFDLSQIRPKGALISGGFKAPGPDPLRLSLDRIEHLLQGLILHKNKTVKLRPIDAYDVMMHASDAVLAGGVRRSAAICLFSPDDTEMLKAKTGNWFQENPQRARSNNSAVIKRDEIKKDDFLKMIESIKQFGEPGFFFVDSLEHLTNPCVEIGLYPQIDGESGWESCNLSEINGGACKDEDTFYKACRAAAVMGTIQAGYTDFKFLGPISKKIIEREALLGVSITGWMSNPDILFNEKILARGAKHVLETNKEVAAMLGINPAARTTCVKPSGTASVLLMTPSGIHPEHAPRYIRHVQMNKDTDVAKMLVQTNPHMVEESAWSTNHSDYVMSFPVVSNKGSLFKDTIKGVTHLDLVKKARRFWVEPGTNVEACLDPDLRHNVSNTIVVDDWDAVAEYVFKNRNFFSGISFISERGDKTYFQAPNTKVMTAQELIKEYKTGGVFASGLIVDALKVFDDLWTAVATAGGMGEDISQEDSTNAAKRDWVRRFEKFAQNYFARESDCMRVAEDCLKDVYLLHKWEKIMQTFQSVEWTEALTEKKFVEADTMAAAACIGTDPQGLGGCFL